MRNLLKSLVAQYGGIPTTAAISVLCVAFSAAVTLTDVLIFDHTLFPALYLSIVTPALIAPPVTFVMIRLIEHLDAAERRVSEELAEREILNRALTKSEERFRDLAELTSDWFWETDADYRFTEVSPVVLEVLGRPTEFFIARSRMDIPEVAVEPQLAVRHRSDIEARRPFRNFECAYKMPDGEVINLSVSGSPVYDDAGEFLGYRGATTNTTARKRAEAALREAHDQLEQRVAERTRELTEEVAERRRAEERLRESEERFRGVFEAAPHGIAISTPDNRFLSANNAYCTMIGYSEEELCEIEFLTITHPDDVEPNRENSRKLLAGEIPFFQMEKRYLHKLGHVVWSHLGVSLVRDESGRPLYFIGQILDITERKRAEAALKRSQADLELRVEERTRELRQEIGERKRAEEALRESEERHRRFAADVAHELRTPLAVMRSNLDSLAEKSEVARSLRTDVDAMTRMVEQLLAAARLETLDIAATDEADLCQVCANVASHIAPIAIKKDRSIEVTGCTRPMLIRGNADALEQALRNLVENALRYSPTESTVTVKVGDDASVSVIDQGPGVPRRQRDAIFQRFVRSDHNTDGAGLGLAIVQRTVEAHGGEIHIDDTPGGGATFTMRFPVDNPPAT